MAIKESNLKIVLAGEFRNKGFKQADTALNKLAGNAKKAAGALGLAFGTAALLSYSKAALRAGLASQAQQERLNQLLKVGVGATTWQIAALNDQAKALEKIGVVTAGNITQTQSQLATFNLQVSTIQTLTPAILDYVTAEKGATASTEQFKSMTNGLAQALQGNFTSLTKTGFVLDESTKKLIKSGTETERAAALVAVLNSTYKDFNKNLRDTPTGQMQLLAASADNVKTIIGVGMIDALKILGDNKSVDGIIGQMEALATSTAEIMTNMAFLIDQIGSIPVVGKALGIVGDFFGSLLGRFSIGRAADLLREMQGINMKKKGFSKGGGGTFNEGPALLIKAEKERLKIAKALAAAELKKLAAEKKKLALEKANAKLSKASAAFDLTKISIAAALKGKIDKETELRLLAMQAIENDNGELALKFLGQLATLQKDNDLAKLAGITTIGDAQLASLNTNLLKELNFINQSKLAQAEKDAAIQAAFGRYNASIKEAGGLADAASYSARTQELQNLVLKVASIETGKDSAITANGILESAQDGSIKRVASAQALADNARMAALMAYIAALNSIGAPGPSPGFGGKRAHEFDFFDAPTSLALNPEGNPNRGGIPPAPIVVQISAGVIAQPDAFVALVQDTLQQINRNGMDTAYAGYIPL